MTALPQSPLDHWLPKLVLCLRQYTWRIFLADLIAGVTVGLVALPLAMAFGIASGVTPQAGIYTAVVGGFLISALGGSRTQIGGPTGAFVVIVAGIIAKFGLSGLLMVTTTPREFANLFPGTGGSLYGRASHGWAASFARPTAKTQIAGLYLAGGSVHPGPGVPMAAISGRLAATQILSDMRSTPRSPKMATPGGISMR